MISQISRAVLWSVCIMFVLGCDPVRTTSQPVRLRVVDVHSGQPLPSVQVSLKEDFEKSRPLPPQEWDMTPDEWQEYRQRNYMDPQPWFSAVTGEQGEATIDVTYTSLDRTTGTKPPSWKDFVTGKPYLIKIQQRNQSSDEVLSVVMKTGESVQGNSSTVTVMHIGEPHYVPK